MCVAAANCVVAKFAGIVGANGWNTMCECNEGYIPSITIVNNA